MSLFREKKIETGTGFKKKQKQKQKNNRKKTREIPSKVRKLISSFFTFPPFIHIPYVYSLHKLSSSGYYARAIY